jgi:hypothetical protein
MAVSKMHIFDPDMGNDYRGCLGASGHVGCAGASSRSIALAFRIGVGPVVTVVLYARSTFVSQTTRRSAGPTDASLLPRGPTGPACGAFR